MPISVTSATPQTATTINVSFNEAFIENADLFDAANYAFRTRFGKQVYLRTKTIEVVSSQIVKLTLTDSMLDGGKYELTVFNVIGSDGVTVQTNTNTANFEGTGDSGKCFDIRKRVPQWWRTVYGTTNHALLCATGEHNDDIAGESALSELNKLAQAMSLRDASGEDLSIIGQNYGVTRNPFVLFDDASFRFLIPIMAAKRKTALKIFYEALALVIGDREVNNWKIFALEANKFILEIPEDVYYNLAGTSPATLDSATYFHEDADSGFAQGSITTNLVFSDGQYINLNDGTNPVKKLELRLDHADLGSGSIWVPISTSFTSSDMRASLAKAIEYWDHPAGQFFVPDNGAAVNESETIIINDGTNPAVTFEWDSDSSVVETATLRAINYTVGMTQVQVRDAMVTAINGAPSLTITPDVLAAEATKFSLYHDSSGTGGNVTITHTTTASGFDVSGMSGGSAASFKISVNTSSGDIVTLIHDDQNAGGNQLITHTTNFIVIDMAGGGTFLGDYFLDDASVLGTTIDDHIIILFQSTTIDQLILPLKAAGIEYEIDLV